jgi:hypothetical protein
VEIKQRYGMPVHRLTRNDAQRIATMRHPWPLPAFRKSYAISPMIAIE